MIMNKDQLMAAARSEAEGHGLDHRVVMAVCEQESGWDPNAWNPEPRYRYFWDVANNKPFRRPSDEELASKVPPKDFFAIAGDRDQEWWAQQASWGLMQVMGAVARELGSRHKYLSILVADPVQCLNYGCEKLKRNLVRENGNMAAALLRYNGGGNASYPNEVLARMEHYK